MPDLRVIRGTVRLVAYALPMTLAEVNREDVLRSIELFNSLGRDEFLDRHRFHRARYFLLAHEGVFYDSKAILGVAHLIRKGELVPFSGGEAAAAPRLRALGFDVLDVRDLSAGEIVQSSLDRELRPGDIKTRAEVAEIFGGGPQGGVVPSISSPTVL